MEDKTINAKFRELLTAHFNLAELQELCFDMHFNFEELPNTRGELTQNVISLINILCQNGRLPEFMELCRKKRPRVEWPNSSEKLCFEVNVQAEAKLQEALEEYKRYIKGKWRRDPLLDGPLADFYITLQGQGPAGKKLKGDDSAFNTVKYPLSEPIPEESVARIQEQHHQDKKEPQFVPHDSLTLDLAKALEKHQRLIVSGTAGTGKSAFLRHLAYQETIYNDSMVPILVSLSDFAKVIENSKQTGLKQWAIEMAHDDPTIQDILNKAVEDNRVLWLLDGFDETGNQINRVADAIAQLPSKNQLVLTTRPDTHLKEHQHRFNATQYEMRDLERKDVEQFLRKWFNNQDKATEVLEWLAADPHRQQLITKPLHLVLLATISKETSNDNFPQTQVQLYGKFIDDYVNKWIDKITEGQGIDGFKEFGERLTGTKVRESALQGFYYLANVEQSTSAGLVSFEHIWR